MMHSMKQSDNKKIQHVLALKKDQENFVQFFKAINKDKTQSLFEKAESASK